MRINKDLIIGISKVGDGNMSVNWGPKNEVLKNREIFLNKLRIDAIDCIWASLEAGDRVAEIGRSDRGKTIICDALITGEEGLALCILTGDCFPVIGYEPKKKILALAHLGRQGVDQRLGQKVINKMTEMGANPELIEITGAPGIEKESYKWYGKLPMSDPEWTSFTEMDNEGFWHIDSAGFIRKQLTDSGINPNNIQWPGTDVFKDTNYFSHVRSVVTGQKEGRFVTVVVRR